MGIVPGSYGVAYVVFIFMLLTDSTFCDTVGEETVYLLNGFDVKWFFYLYFCPSRNLAG